METPLRLFAFHFRTLTWVLAAAVGLSAQAVRLEKSESRPVTEAIQEDAEVAKTLEPFTRDIRRMFDRVLTSAQEPLYRSRGFNEENRLGYWVADLMRAKAAQVVGQPVKAAITNSGGLRANLRAGQVKVENIYEVMPFENELMVAEYTGAELVQIVKEALNRRAGEPMSGLLVRVVGTVEKPELTITWEDGKAIDPAEVVRVALTDYLYSSGDGIPTLKQGRKAIPTGVPLRDLLVEECSRLGRLKAPLVAPAPGRITFTEPVWQALKERKLKL